MKNALFLTGAAALISQEVALIDKLIEKKGLEISPEQTMLAGFSSGALNIGAINACYRKENPLSWNDYFKDEVLFKIKTSDVFVREKFIPVNTQPLRETLTDFLDNADLNTVHDLTFESFILTFSYRRLTTLWASNLFNQHHQIKLLDLMMATTAIPLIFPDQTIHSLDDRKRKSIKGRFVDGGAGGSFKRFEHYLKKYQNQQGQLDKIYIISPMREVSPEDYEELNKMVPSTDLFRMDIKDFKVLRFFMEMISKNGFDSFIKRFHRWTKNHHIANEIYVCIPQMDKNFPLLNFDHQKKQYHSVCKWVDENPDKLAIPLAEYVERFEKLPLREIRLKLERNLKHRLRSIGVK